jgi:GT2 family glycosyltransferase
VSLLGVVAIGRNEGERLIRCFQSLSKLLPKDTPIAYVDSGSTDGSCEKAREMGIHVIDLDLSIPFTAARARNAGWEYLVNQHSDLTYVQFLDGDCQLVENWIEEALSFLESNNEYAIVCGRRCELYPDHSPYNRLTDMEWNTPIGEAPACGGDAVIRVKTLQEVNGYDGRLICGEEPEMCIRMRRKGWKIYRMDSDMTMHDANMLKFNQWWRRSIRTGWAIAEGYALYGKEPEQYMKKENFSGWLWGLILPFSIICSLFISKLLSLILILPYFYLAYRIYKFRLNFGDNKSHSLLYAKYCTFSKLPQVIGQIKYWITRARGKTATIIEYKR